MRNSKLKKIIKSNKHMYSIAKKINKKLLKNNSEHEVYDYLKFYPTKEEIKKQVIEQEKLKFRPLISIIVPTYNTNSVFLKACIESVLDQSYDNWELSMADDMSTKKEVVEIIKSYQKKDSRIKLIERKKNGHISKASNDAILNASGEYFALLDHDDLLWPNALFEIVKVVNNNPKVDFIYTDEDKIDSDSKIHSYPFFKPDWSPEFLESCNYITHLSCIKKSIVEKVGGFRVGYEGAQDWDLFLRATEVTDRIYHIPKVLYSWRVHEESTAQDTDAKPYVYKAQKMLLEDHLNRTGYSGKVKSGIIWQHSVIDYSVNGEPEVLAILFINKKHSKAISYNKFKNSGYKNIKIEPFYLGESDSVSRLNSLIKNSNCEYILFIEEDHDILTKNWLKIMLGDAQRPGIGAVGGKILSATKKEEIISSGLGFGINGGAGYLLRGSSVEDNHYMRALYGKSKRNIIAVSTPYLLSRKAFDMVGGFDNNLKPILIDLCVKLVEANFRNVYNPFIEVSANPKNYNEISLSKEFNIKWSKYINKDPYLNVNYKKTNGNLEVIKD